MKGNFIICPDVWMMRFQALLAIGAFCLATSAVAAAAPFSLTSPAFADGGRLSVDAAAVRCGGKEISPPLAWANAPAATTSYAITIFDQDGAKGQGVSHLVAYGIAPTVTSIPAGFTSVPSPGFVAGTNFGKTAGYLGLCPPPGAAPHHYVFTVYALDLAPAALAPGLTRDTFYPAIANHTLDVTSLVGLYSR